MRTVIIDNYDSFTYNLYQYLGELGASPVVFRNDQITIHELKRLEPSHIVISPGPGDPRDESYFGICREIISRLGQDIPLLGVCLGHQGIGYIYRGNVVRAPQVMHGKTSLISHHGRSIFKGIASPLIGMRYHSLIVDRPSLPDCLRITAESEDGLIMGLEHVRYPIYGIQFHPESIGTASGKDILRNFLEKRRQR